MRKFHFNSETGKTGVCTAKIKCRLGIPVDDHYDSADAARAAYEATQEANQIKTLTKSISPEENSRSVITVTTSVDELPTFNGRYSPAYLDFCDSPSTMICPDCSKPINQKQVSELLEYGRETHCRHCYESFYIDEVEVEVDKKFVDIEDNTENVKKRTWFHSTTRYEWEKGVRENNVGTIHVGSPEAAVDRILSLSDSSQPTFVYEIEIIDDAVVSEEIVPDEISFKFEEKSDRADLEGIAVLPYMNRWEHPGSVALAVRPDAMRVVGVKPFTLNQARKVLTAYNIF